VIEKSMEEFLPLRRKELV